MKITGSNPSVPHAVEPRQPLFNHGALIGARLARRKLLAIRPEPVLWSRTKSVLRAGLECCRRVLRDRLRQPARLLTVSETVHLGDRRTVSIVQFGSHRFLIGCASSSITLLASLPNACKDESASDICSETGPASEGRE